MKITPIKDFLYSLDGIRAASFEKGVVANVPDGIGEKLLEAEGYIEGGKEATKAPEAKAPEPKLDDIEGMKKSYIKVLAEAGVDTVAQLKEMSVKQIADLDGISEKGAEKIVKGLEKL